MRFRAGSARAKSNAPRRGRRSRYSARPNNPPVCSSGSPGGGHITAGSGWPVGAGRVGGVRSLIAGSAGPPAANGEPPASRGVPPFFAAVAVRGSVPSGLPGSPASGGGPGTTRSLVGGAGAANGASPPAAADAQTAPVNTAAHTRNQTAIRRPPTGRSEPTRQTLSDGANGLQPRFPEGVRLSILASGGRQSPEEGPNTPLGGLSSPARRIPEGPPPEGCSNGFGRWGLDGLPGGGARRPPGASVFPGGAARNHSTRFSAARSTLPGWEPPPGALTSEIGPPGRGVLSRKTRSATFAARRHFARPRPVRVIGCGGPRSVI